ncbi:alpha-xylosidase [Clostridium felsineum]|uniref:alpha-xylosidase n=1 Tax=Clostridium felsineum TaxID=36839 RepID=UPI00214D64A0|nr:alpha-xylosidase [Clostridium felsineum]MCR3759729.1 alpha-xylosidase [Clostridium felsineum]
MKFTNGYWLIKEGYKIINPKVAYEIDIKDKEVTVYAPCTTIENRGKTLDGGMITLKISSPIEDVLRVRIYHHIGLNKGPNFQIKDEKLNLSCEDTNNTLEVKSGSLSAKISKRDWKISFENEGKVITESLPNGIGYVTEGKKKSYVKEELGIDVGELIYGLGERFTPFVKNGQTVDIWNEDGGTGSEQSYKNIPFYISNKGYGVFVNHPEKVSFEVASEKVSRVQFAVEGEYLEYFIINGPQLKDVIKRYTTLTGKPALPPAWSFGLWLSTSFLTDYDEETVLSFIEGMKERDIPLDVFHFDCFWMKEFEWCNFKWDERLFKNPVKMLEKIKSTGVKTCVWINPYIGQKSPLFEEALEKGYLLKRENGAVWQWDMWQAGLAVVDFTNPDATAWFQSKLEKLVNMGVDAFKTDFGERIPTDVVYYDGSDPNKMHNYYTYLYNKAVFDLLKRRKGEKEAVLFARSATVGGQKFPVHWGGDCTSNYNSMAESLRGGLSFTLSGFGFWSHDIGGFENGTTADLYKRWTQFGLLSTHSRYHGSGEYKVPWIHDDEAVEVTRKFTKLKCSLMPYLYKNACETAETGVPMVRAMVLEFTEDETCGYLDRQYMLGGDLIVAPIFNDKGTVKYYLPKGKWTNILTGDVLEGEKWYDEKYDYMTLPLLARENSIITFGNTDKKAEYDYTENPTFNIFQLQEGKLAKTSIYDASGVKKASIKAEKRENQISFEVNGIDGEYSVLLRNVNNVESVSTGKCISTEEGIKITLSGNELKVKL